MDNNGSETLKAAEYGINHIRARLFDDEALYTNVRTPNGEGDTKSTLKVAQEKEPMVRGLLGDLYEGHITSVRSQIEANKMGGQGGKNYELEAVLTRLERGLGVIRGNRANPDSLLATLPEVRQLELKANGFDSRYKSERKSFRPSDVTSSGKRIEVVFDYAREKAVAWANEVMAKRKN